MESVEGEIILWCLLASEGRVDEEKKKWEVIIWRGFCAPEGRRWPVTWQ
jgi:hypothetical protein